MCYCFQTFKDLYQLSYQAVTPVLLTPFRWGCKGKWLFITNKLFLCFSARFSLFFRFLYPPFLTGFFLRFFSKNLLFFRAGCKDKRLHIFYQIFLTFFLYLLFCNSLTTKELCEKASPGISSLIISFCNLCFSKAGRKDRGNGKLLPNLFERNWYPFLKTRCGRALQSDFFLAASC